MRIKARKQCWTEDEIALEVQERTGQVPTVLWDGLQIVLEFRQKLAEHERTDLQTYFRAEHDLLAFEERKKSTGKRAELRSRIARMDDPKSDLRDVVLALAEWLEIIEC